LKQLRAKLASNNTEANASSFTGVTNASSFTGVTNASSLTGDPPPVEEVDLTGGDQPGPPKDLTNLDIDDNEAEKDVEEMYSTDVEAAEVSNKNKHK
jgi:hypothetical protein